MRFFSKEGWLKYHEREEKELKKIDELIKKKDEMALGKWLKEFGKSKKSFWFPTDEKKLDKNSWL